MKLRKFKKAEIDKRVREAAKILDIEHLLDRKPKALSGGQRQRVALGRAIVREPQVFLMDEPLSNLDAKLRGQMRAEISKLAKRLETTVIYVTHDQIEAMTMGDRIVVMKDGIIQQAASPEELYNHPVNIFVAGFIGAPSMNFITGTLSEQGGAVRFKANNIDVACSRRQSYNCFVIKAISAKKSFLVFVRKIFTKSQYSLKLHHKQSLMHMLKLLRTLDMKCTCT